MKDVAAEVERAGGHALVVRTDVAEWPQVERLAAAAVERFGRIDTWVNNAGIGLGGMVADQEVAEIDRLIRVNLMGQVHGVKAALPYMKDQGGGAFINIGSVAGVRTFPLQTMYCASKHAVKGFTEGLRLELEREPGEFHVTYIAPAAINTPFFRSAGRRSARSSTPRRRCMTRRSWPSRSSSPPSIPAATSSSAGVPKCSTSSSGSARRWSTG